jgi:hypothetical protein
LVDGWECLNRASQRERAVLSRIPLWCLLLADNLEGIFVRLAEIASIYRKAGRELLLSCAVGCLWGLGVGLFIFLRLGAPATHELSGYMVGLFLTAGLKFGFWLYVIRSLIMPGIRTLRHKGPKSTDELRPSVVLPVSVGKSG